VSWLGMLAFLLIGLGWAKPVWVDQARFRIKNRDLGMFLVSIAGVTANFATALLVLLGMAVTMTVVWMSSGSSLYDVLQFMMPLDLGPDARGVAVALSYYMLMVNLLLGLFNLLPLPPLDGFQALQSLYRWLRHATDRTRAAEVAPRATVEVASGTWLRAAPPRFILTSVWSTRGRANGTKPSPATGRRSSTTRILRSPITIRGLPIGRRTAPRWRQAPSAQRVRPGMMPRCESKLVCDCVNWLRRSKALQLRTGHLLFPWSQDMRPRLSLGPATPSIRP
jgi:Zn-dependent protease